MKKGKQNGSARLCKRLTSNTTVDRQADVQGSAGIKEGQGRYDLKSSKALHSVPGIGVGLQLWLRIQELLACLGLLPVLLGWLLVCHAGGAGSGETET